MADTCHNLFITREDHNVIDIDVYTVKKKTLSFLTMQLNC